MICMRDNGDERKNMVIRGLKMVGEIVGVER